MDSGLDSRLRQWRMHARPLKRDKVGLDKADSTEQMKIQLLQPGARAVQTSGLSPCSLAKAYEHPPRKSLAENHLTKAYTPILHMIFQEVANHIL